MSAPNWLRRGYFREGEFARFLEGVVAEAQAILDSLPKPDPEFERQRVYRERKK